MNKVLLVWNVSKAQELKKTNSDSDVITLRIATNETIKRGDKTENETTFHTCVFWNHLARYASTFEAGDIVAIEGKLREREYVDKKDIKRYVTEIYVEKVKMISKKANRHPSN